MITLNKIEYPYSLSYFKGSRYLECPSCGKRRFKPYCTADGVPIDATKFGRCQREFKCGYHQSPNKKEYSPVVREFVPLDPFFLPSDYVLPYLNNVDFSSLLTFFNKSKIDFTPIFKDYKVGGTRNGKTIFFQYDGLKWRAGKQMEYCNGYRSGHVWWLHRDERLGFNEDKYRLCQCFFGYHLVAKNPDKMIALVESEKTALFCAGVFPEFIWLATGGQSQLSSVNMELIGGRGGVIFPDVDCIPMWAEKVATFKRYDVIDCTHLNVADKKGADLFDFLVGENKHESYRFIKEILEKRKINAK